MRDLNGTGYGPPEQGYLTHEKQRPPGTLQQDSARGPVVALGGWAVLFERGTHVRDRDKFAFPPCQLGR